MVEGGYQKQMKNSTSVIGFDENGHSLTISLFEKPSEKSE